MLRKATWRKPEARFNDSTYKIYNCRKNDGSQPIHG